MRKLILLSLLLTPSFASAECNSNAQVRIVDESNLKATHLYNLIKGKFPSWASKFHSEEFTYLGRLENGIDAAWLFTSWGASTCRGTTRLLLFQADKYLGSFAVNHDEVTLINNKIIFPYDKNVGNVIDLSKGIPKEIWIDGELPTFMKSEL